MGIKVSGVTFGYDKQLVLHDLSLDIKPGKLTIILGPNGGGKSTLLKLIAGLLPCDIGRIEIEGNLISKLGSSARARLIGYLAQSHHPSFPFSCIEVVLTGRASYVFSGPRKEDLRIADAALDRVGINHLRDRAYTDISGGERQLVMIARVLAQEPRIILLDEPLTHLDLASQTRLFCVIEDLVRSGLTIVAVLHDPNAAFVFGEEFLLLKGGRLVEVRSGSKPWGALTLSELYGTHCEMIAFGDRALAVPRKGLGGA